MVKSELGYENMTLVRTSADKVALLLNDTSYIAEIANMVKQPIRDFKGLGETTPIGTKIIDRGFLFQNEIAAEEAAQRIVTEIYRKKD